MVNTGCATEPKPVSVAKSLTKHARDKALIAKAQMTSIARQCGVNRMTISRHIDGADLSISEFLAIAQEAGFDPVDMLQTEISKYETENKPALADEGAEE